MTVWCTEEPAMSDLQVFCCRLYSSLIHNFCKVTLEILHVSVTEKKKKSQGCSTNVISHKHNRFYVQDGSFENVRYITMPPTQKSNLSFCVFGAGGLCVCISGVLNAGSSVELLSRYHILPLSYSFSLVSSSSLYWFVVIAFVFQYFYWFIYYDQRLFW